MRGVTSRTSFVLYKKHFYCQLKVIFTLPESRIGCYDDNREKVTDQPEYEKRE